jgi:hypothetical protein
MTTATATPPLTTTTPWLFSARVDLGVFLGSALLAFALLALGRALGLRDEDAAPEWTWVAGVLLVDVAHVWSTLFRVYLDRRELSRRPLLYGAVPAIAWLAGVLLYAQGGRLVFWRVLAYVAVFHFVRQQWGWVALYRGRAGERDRLGRAIDSAAIHAATLVPLLHWHASSPRRFDWFMSGDFVRDERLASLMPLAWSLYALALAAYAVRAFAAWRAGRANPGKDVVVATTAACWFTGIVALNSDYAFTVTNVLIHGVPYLALVFWYGRTRCREEGAKGVFALFQPGPVPFLVVLWLLGYAEELLWDRAVWHERAWLFGAPWDTRALEAVIAPLLAVPQLTHYVLDGFVWRRRTNPAFTLLEATP